MLIMPFGLRLTLREPITAPPENVELIAPMIALVLSVLKNSKKLGESMTWRESQIRWSWWITLHLVFEATYHPSSLRSRNRRGTTWQRC